MPRRRRWRWQVLGFITALILVLAGGAGFWLRGQLRASLPTLDGSVALAGLSAPVSVTRDSLGIPTVRGASREDVARATGFLHAQDRFFQMDLMRRRAAGEISELVGPRALQADREIRIHRFRAEARQAVTLLTAHDRTVLGAYTAGVNAGLAALGAAPFEYLLLRQTPQPWREEDAFLVVLSMFVTLQDTDGAYESTLATMHEVLPAQMFDFLDPRGTEWDAPVVGPAFSMPPVPGPDIYDLRARRKGKPGITLPPRPQDVKGSGGREPGALAVNGRLRGWALLLPEWERGLNARHDAIGSNSWVVSGRLTGDVRRLLANDMHLAVRVRLSFYRAAVHWNDRSEACV
jgi:penicillin amidase